MYTAKELEILAAIAADGSEVMKQIDDPVALDYYVSLVGTLAKLLALLEKGKEPFSLSQLSGYETQVLRSAFVHTVKSASEDLRAHKRFKEELLPLYEKFVG